jgi:uncharacterized protein (TIGR00369 family)
MTHAPRDPDYEARVRASFARQRFMATLGATIERVAPGEVAIAFGFRDDLTQQHGYLHAGVMTAIADSACGYAALTLMEPNAGVLAVEFKVNLLAPGKAPRFVAEARVVRSGRTLTVCSCEVIAEADGARTTIALMQGTMMAVRGREGVAD